MDRIRIRGANSASLSNEPLVIVDGVQITSRGGQFVSTAGTVPPGGTAGRSRRRDRRWTTRAACWA